MNNNEHFHLPSTSLDIEKLMDSLPKIPCKQEKTMLTQLINYVLKTPISLNAVMIVCASFLLNVGYLGADVNLIAIIGMGTLKVGMVVLLVLGIGVVFHPHTIGASFTQTGAWSDILLFNVDDVMSEHFISGLSPQHANVIEIRTNQATYTLEKRKT